MVKAAEAVKQVDEEPGWMFSLLVALELPGETNGCCGQMYQGVDGTQHKYQPHQKLPN
jgi:hypothetical protein